MFAAAGLAALSAPALAQMVNPDELNDAQIDELYCVRDALADDPDLRAVLLHTVTGQSSHAEASGKAQAAAKAKCAAKYKWSPGQAGVAASLAVWALVAEAAEDNLAKAGYDEYEIEEIFEISNALTEEDVEKAQREHGDKAVDAIVKRIKTILVENGFPNDDDQLSAAVLLLEASSNETDAAYEWVEKRFY